MDLESDFLINYCVEIELHTGEIKHFDLNIMDAKRCVESFFYGYANYVVLNKHEIIKLNDIKSIKIHNYIDKSNFMSKNTTKKQVNFCIDTL